jgi:electron transport complex protein RnfB
MDVSAVKCAHDFTMCGYCELCTAFFVPEPNELNSGAENQLCPVGAIRRRFVEDPYYEYDIDTDVCYGCGKCVKGCTQFGNGSLYLQIDQDRCLHCNECSIAAACPADAFFHRSAGRPYVTKHAGAENL